MGTNKWKPTPLLLLYLVTILIVPFSLHTTITNRLFPPRLLLRPKALPRLPLRFSSHGTFKILQVADMHYGNGLLTRCRDLFPEEFFRCSDLNSTRFLERMIQAEKPDFVEFTGDNIFGTTSRDAAESMLLAFRPVIESGIPWAAVLGNHDQESTMSREDLMSFISQLDFSVAQINPLAEDESGAARGHILSNIDGFGNYNLRVYGAPGSQVANTSVLNLYFLDTGDREVVDGIQTYGWIKVSQLRWLRNVSDGYQGRKEDIATNGLRDTLFPDKPPAMAFFHIPIPEVQQLFYQNLVGQFQQDISCSLVNSGVLQTFVSMEDIKAAFMGHDHTNYFCGNLDGIWFCYGGGFGYHGYGKVGWPRRARVIQAELVKGQTSWMAVQRFRTWKHLDDRMLSKIDEQVLWES